MMEWTEISMNSMPDGQLSLFCDMDAKELKDSFFVDWMVNGQFCGNRYRTATHWMPLPPAPTN